MVGLTELASFHFAASVVARALPSPAYSRRPLLLVKQLSRWFVSLPTASLKIRKAAFWQLFLFLMVGLTGLEPATSSSRTKRSTRLNYNPNAVIVLPHNFILTIPNFRFFRKICKNYSTVTDFAKFRGLSTSRPNLFAIK